MPQRAVGAVLVVSDAGIDHDVVVARAHQVALHREQQRAGSGVHGLGREPATMRRPVLVPGLGEEGERIERRHLLQDPPDGHLPQCQQRHVVPSPVTRGPHHDATNSSAPLIFCGPRPAGACAGNHRERSSQPVPVVVIAREQALRHDTGIDARAQRSG
jgi:hypothetical protein